MFLVKWPMIWFALLLMIMHHWLTQHRHHPWSSWKGCYVSSWSSAGIDAGGYSAAGLRKIVTPFNLLKTLKFWLIQLSYFMQSLQPEALSLTMSASPSNLITPLFRSGGLTHCEGQHRQYNYRDTHRHLLTWIPSGCQGFHVSNQAQGEGTVRSSDIPFYSAHVTTEPQDLVGAAWLYLLVKKGEDQSFNVSPGAGTVSLDAGQKQPFANSARA